MMGPTFYTEDVCCLKSNHDSLGIVERTTSDIDSHTPHPDREYEELECHGDISTSVFERFKRTGIPPANTVLVEWYSKPSIQLIPTSHLLLIDRAFLVGDIVKRNTQDAKSGTVTETDVICTLRRSTTAEIRTRVEQTSKDAEPRFMASSPADMLLEIPAAEIMPAKAYQEGSFIIFQDWVGRIEDVFDDITIRLPNGTIVEVESAEDLRPTIQVSNSLDVGDIVRTTKRNLKRGRWIQGKFDSAIFPCGDIVRVHTKEVAVSWLCRCLCSVSKASSQAEPPSTLGIHVLQSGEAHVYDRARSPSSTNGSDSSYGCCVDFMIGTGVRFKDPAGAALKYDGTKPVANTDHKNFVQRIPPASSHGFDLNVYTIVSMKTRATVLWQDCQVTREESTSLVPDINLEDESEVWPGEIVMSNQLKSIPGQDWILQPNRVGIAQSVSADDRLAKVLWLPHAKILYHNITDVEDDMAPALLPESSLGLTIRPHLDPSQLNNPPDAYMEDVTLYDIRPADGVNKRRGDLVMLHPPSELGLSVSDDLDWIGEVVDLRQDGFLVVRLGAARRVRDICVAPEFATIVYSTDEDYDLACSDSEYDAEDECTGISTGSTDEGEWETDNGVPLSVADGDGDPDAWSTASEDESDVERVQSLQEPGNSSRDSTFIAAATDDLFAANLRRKRESTPQRSMGDDASMRMEGIEATPTKLTNSFPSEKNASSNSVPTPHNSQLYDPTLSSPDSFAILDTPAPDSTPYLTPTPEALSPQLMKRIAKEHRILSSSLPDGIFVRTWESRLDLLRVLIIGPLETPYEFSPFIIDFKLPPTFPREPPLAHFHSWTEGHGPVNPNLYENGKICLSLLGTWPADEKGENWSPARSTILQILVSLLGLVLVKEPYYCEAGFEVRAGQADAAVPSALYSERTYFRSRAFIHHALNNEIAGFDDVIRWLYVESERGAPRLLDRAINAAKEVMDTGVAGSEVRRGGLTKISKGALVMLERELRSLEGAKSKLDGSMMNL